MKNKHLLIFFTLLLLSASTVSAVFSTSINSYDDGSDNQTYVRTDMIFYTNYSSDDDYNLGQVMYRNPTDLSTGYYVRAFDPDGVGNKTALVYSESDNIRAHYANGTEIWDSYNSAFDYAYGMESGDYNGDGQEEIAFISSGGSLFILNGTNGSIIYESTDYYTGYTMADGDLDDDGLKNDFAIGVRDINGATGNNYGIVALVYNGTTWNENWTSNDATAAPIDIDISEVTGENLVAFTDNAGGKAIVYYGNGTQKWITADRGTAYSITFFDQDSDGEEDEVAMGEYSELRIYTDTGTESTATAPTGNEYEIEKIDLDEDGIYDDILISSNYHTVRAYNSDLTLAWTFVAPFKGFESTYYASYLTNIKVGNVNNDSSDEIIVGGYSRRYYILNLSGDIIGKHYHGDEENLNNIGYIGLIYGKSPGIDIMNDTNGDGINEILSDRISGYFYVGQQVMCKININGTEDYMYYNYSSSLWEYYYSFKDTGFDRTVFSNSSVIWNVTCEKSGYETQTSQDTNITVILKNSTLDVFDQEDDDENNAGWLSEDIVTANESTYFFANYTDASTSTSPRDLTITTDWFTDFGNGYGFYDVAALDSDGDGIKDGFAYSQLDGVSAYTFSGSLIWTRTDTQYDYCYNLKTGDFNNDGFEEVACSGSYGVLAILNGTDGTEIFQSSDYYTAYTLGVGDINNDSIDEVILGVRDINAGTATNYGLVAFTWDGSTFVENWTASDLTVYPVEIQVSKLSSGESLVGVVDYSGIDDFVIYYGNGTKKCQSIDLVSYLSTLDFIDFDGDGDRDEIIVGEYGETYVYNEDCTRNRTDTASESLVYEISEIDYDGNSSTVEYVFFERYDIRLINSSGDVVWYYPVQDDLYGMMDVIDLDDDGEEEIIFGGYSGGLHILNLSGAVKYMYDLTSPSDIDSSAIDDEFTRMNFGFYGKGAGFEFANVSNGVSYFGYAVDEAYVGAGEIYPRCIIRFNDSITAKMSYNISAGLYYYERNFTAQGSYDWNVTCESYGHVTQTLSDTINANTPPSEVTITNTPSSLDNLDPNITIVIEANISDVNSNLDTAILQWMNVSDGTWNNVTMENTTTKGAYTILTANFTPAYSVESNYTYKIWANDTESASSTSSNTTIVVYWDCTWNATSSLDAVAGWDENKFIGNISINNTGDSEYSGGCSLDFRLTYNLAEGRVYFDTSYYKPSSTYTIAEKVNQTIVINATFGTDVLQEDVIITTTELLGITNTPSRNTTATLISNQAGPYLYQVITSNPASAYLTPGNLTLNGYLRNLMGADSFNESNTAYNVSFNWTLPSGLTNNSGNESINLPNLTDSDLHYNNVNISFSDLASFSPGIQTITLFSEGYNISGNLIEDASGNQNLTDSFNITFLCYNESDGIYVTACGTLDADYVAPSEGGTSGGGGGGGSGGDRKFESIVSRIGFQLVRGEQNEVEIEFENTDDNRSISNAIFTVSGKISKYIEIYPTIISEIAPGQKVNITLKINSPTYIELGKQELKITMKGRRGIRDLTETKTITLEIHELTGEEAAKLLEESEEFIKQLEEANLSYDYLIELYNESKEEIANFDYELVRDNHKIIKSQATAALKSKKIIDELTGLLDEAQKKGVNTFNSRKLLKLAQISLGRKEFEEAYEKAKNAQLTYSLEVKGEFGELSYYLEEYPMEISLSAIFLVLFSFGSFKLGRLQMIKKKIKRLKREEKLIEELIGAIQIETFKENKMSMEEYQTALEQYQKRQSHIIEELIEQETKRIHALKFTREEKRLNEEKERVIELVKELQKDYLGERTVETRSYELRVESYNKRLTDIDEKLALLEAKRAFKRGAKKILSGGRKVPKKERIK